MELGGSADLIDRALDIAIVPEAIAALAHDDVAVEVTFVCRVTHRTDLPRRSHVAEMDPVG